jgi:hypothetical protein
MTFNAYDIDAHFSKRNRIKFAGSKSNRTTRKTDQLLKSYRNINPANIGTGTKNAIADAFDFALH